MRPLSSGVLASLTLVAACDLEPPPSAPAVPASRLRQAPVESPAPPPVALVRPAADAPPVVALAQVVQEEPPAPPPAAIPPPGAEAALPLATPPSPRRGEQARAERSTPSVGGLNRVPVSRDQRAPGGGAPGAGRAVGSDRAGAPPNPPAPSGRLDAPRRHTRKP